jgi:hypothetical protein
MAAFGFKVYDADQVKITLAGLPIDSGYADGEFLTIAPEGVFFGDVVGSDGEVTRFKSFDRRANCGIILMQTSEGHGRLSTLHNTDRLAPGGAGVGPFLVEDLNGSTLHSSPRCWIAGYPDVAYGREPGGWEWPIRIAHLEAFLAGT